MEYNVEFGSLGIFFESIVTYGIEDALHIAWPGC